MKEVVSKIRQAISITLAVAMVATSLPQTAGVAFAAETDGAIVGDSAEKETSIEAEEIEESGAVAEEAEEAALETATESGAEAAGESSADEPTAAPSETAKESVIEGPVTVMPEDAWKATGWDGQPDYDKVNLTGNTKDGSFAIGEDKTVSFDGNLAYVTGFTGFSTEEALQKGNYVALRIPVSEEAYAAAKEAGESAAVVTIKGNDEKNFDVNAITEEITEEEKDYYIDLIMRVPDSKSFTVTADWDGEGAAYNATTYTFDLSGVNLETAEEPLGAESTIEGPVVVMPEEAWKATGWEGQPDYDKVNLTGNTKDGSFAIGEEDNTVSFDGNLAYVTGFTGFSSDESLQEGNYVALRIPVSEEAYTAAVAAGENATVVTIKGNDEKNFDFNAITEEEKDYYIDLIMRVPDSKSFTVTANWDGDGNDYKDTTYTFDLSDVTLESVDSSGAESVIEGPVVVMPEEAWKAIEWENKPGYAQVSLNGNTKDGKFTIGEDNTVSFDGELAYVESFTGFNLANEEEQKGWYVALRIPVSEEAYTAAAAASENATVVTIKGNNEKKFDYTAIEVEAGNYYIDLVMRVPDNKSFTVTANWDGDGADYKETTYTFDLTGVTLLGVDKGTFEAVGYEEISKVAATSENDGLTLRYRGKIPYVELSNDFAKKLGYKDENGNLITAGNFVAAKITAPADIVLSGDKTTITYDNDTEPKYTWVECKDDDRYVYQIFRVTGKSTEKKVTVNWVGKVGEASVTRPVTYTFRVDSTATLEAAQEPVAAKKLTAVSYDSEMYVGETQQLDVLVTKNNPDDYVKVKFVSSSPSIIKVTDEETGSITAKSATSKKVTITAYAVDKDGKQLGTVKATYKIKVVNKLTAPKSVKATNISDRDATITWTAGDLGSADDDEYKYYIYLQEGSKKKTSFTPNNLLCQVDGDEVSISLADACIKPYQKYTVYVEAVRGTLKAGTVKTFTTLKAVPEDIELTASDEYAYKKGGSVTLTATPTYYDYNGDETADEVDSKKAENLVWSSSNTKVATVNSKGKVTFKGGGTTTITVASKSNPEAIDSAEIKITNKATKIGNKSTTVVVGQTINVSEIVKYTGGVSSDPEYTIVIPSGAEKMVRDNGDDTLTIIGTTNPKKTVSVKIQVTDNNVTSSSKNKATATLKIKKLTATGTPTAGKVRETSVAVNFTESKYATGYLADIYYKNDKNMTSPIDSVYVDANDEKVTVGKKELYQAVFTELKASTNYKVYVTALYEDGPEEVGETNGTATKSKVKNVTTTKPLADPEAEDKELFDVKYYDGTEFKTVGTELVMAVNNSYQASVQVPDLVRTLESDKLTWKSSNSKVVAVKANKATFDATLTAKKSGTAIVTATSKGTKSVVAEINVVVYPYQNDVLKREKIEANVNAVIETAVENALSKLDSVEFSGVSGMKYDTETRTLAVTLTADDNTKNKTVNEMKNQMSDAAVEMLDSFFFSSDNMLDKIYEEATTVKGELESFTIAGNTNNYTISMNFEGVKNGENKLNIVCVASDGKTYKAPYVLSQYSSAQELYNEIEKDVTRKAKDTIGDDWDTKTWEECLNKAFGEAAEKTRNMTIIYDGDEINKLTYPVKIVKE